jgi:hypothetical protein
MASPALASRFSRVRFRTRVSTPRVALEAIVEGGVCAWLCVEASDRVLLFEKYKSG